jgi:cytochrome c-type biogenesis protein
VGDLPLLLAVSAGAVAALNPCGFVLLPAYLSMLVVGEQERSRREAAARALGASASMTAGFAAVFVTFGLVLAPVAGQVQRHLPWFTVALGVLLVATGAWLLSGRELPAVPLPAGRGRSLTWSALSMAGFGAAYALASLSCTVGPFLAIVVSAFRAGSVASGLALFVAYAVGMGLVVGVASLAVAFARHSVVHGLRRTARVVPRIGGAVLLVAGAYVAYYGWYENAVLGGADPQDPVVEAAGRAQEWLAGSVGRTAILALLALLIAAAAGALLAGRIRRRSLRMLDD